MLDVPPLHASQDWVREMERAGVDAFAITSNIDIGVGVGHPLARARAVRTWSKLPAAVSGGFSLTGLSVRLNRPDWDILIVGRSITEAPRPQALPSSFSGPCARSRRCQVMQITALSEKLAEDVLKLMELGVPYVRARGSSDYWLYAHLFSSTCPVAIESGTVIGAAIAMRSQDAPEDVYIQDVMTHPDHRRKGVAVALVRSVRDRAVEWGCRRIYLTSEPENTAAYSAWTSLGFVNTAGDYQVNGVDVTRDFKGPGKDRAVFELLLL